MAARIFWKGRKPHPREPRGAGRAVLVDYRLESVNAGHLNAFYDRIGYRERLEPGLLAHVGGVLDKDQVVYLSIWRSESLALESWHARRDDVEAVLADAPPDAKVTRRSSDVHRLYLGDGLLDLREGAANTEPACFGYVIDLPRVDLGTYDLICAQMDFPDNWPEGLLMHVVGQVDDFLRVLSIWRRADQSRRFFENKLIAASVEVVRDHGLFPEIRPRALEVKLMALNNELYE